MYNASRTGERFWFQRVRSYQSLVSSGKHVPDAKALCLSTRLGSGFQAIDDVLVPATVREAIRRGVEATVALDHYFRRQPDGPLLADVILAANEAQRAFLELIAESISGLDYLVHEGCRLAALVS